MHSHKNVLYVLKFDRKYLTQIFNMTTSDKKADE
jgi:hypothetical protein